MNYTHSFQIVQYQGRLGSTYSHPQTTAFVCGQYLQDKMSDGCLTREQFNNAIDMFAEKCQILNENWCVRYVEVHMHGYNQ